MSDTYDLTLTLKKNGRPLSESVKRITVAQSQLTNFTQVSGGGAVALPMGQVGTPTFFLLTTDQTQTLALGNITLNPGSLILFINATPATETLTNASGSDSINSLIAGGS